MAQVGKFMMKDEELLRLYAADQAERKKFSQIKDANEKEKMRITIRLNDVKRKELVEDIMPGLKSSIRRDIHDYFHAATIYSRGNMQADREKAYGYAKKAFLLAQLKQDDFSEQVKDLYASTYHKLKIHDDLSMSPKLTPLHLRPNAPKSKNIQEDEKDKAKKSRYVPTCCVCGKQHNGPCSPRR